MSDIIEPRKAQHRAGILDMHMCTQLVLGKGKSHLTDKETEDQAAEWLALVTPSLRAQASSSYHYLFPSLKFFKKVEIGVTAVPLLYRAWL